MKASVIDQNFFRKLELRTRLEKASIDDIFVVTDNALIEMLKSPQWYSTARQSLKSLADFPDKAVVALPMCELLRTELTLKQPISNVISGEATEPFRHLLLELGKDTPGRSVDYAKNQLPAAVTGLVANQLDHNQNKKTLIYAEKTIRFAINFKNLRKHDAHRKAEIKNYVVRTLATHGALPILLEHGFSDTEAQTFLATCPCILRLNLGLYLIAFKWAELNGLSNLPEEKCTNELMDLDYAVIATYCDEILTKEKSVSDLRSDIIAIIQQ